MRLPKLELRRALSNVEADARFPIRQPIQSAEILGPLLRGLEVEVAMALLLDGRHRPIGVVEVARGSSNVVHVPPRELFRIAIHVGAVALVMAHCHPTNDSTPSPDDLDLTRRMTAAGDLIGIAVLDHLILTDSEFFSFTSGRKGRWVQPSAGGAELLMPVATLLVAATGVDERRSQ